MELWRANINFRGMRPGREVIIDPKDWEPEIEAGFLTKVQPTKPQLNDAKKDWVAYAQSVGVDPSGTKQELIDRLENL